MYYPSHLLTSVLKPLTALLKETKGIYRSNTVLQNMDMWAEVRTGAGKTAT